MTSLAVAIDLMLFSPGLLLFLVTVEHQLNLICAPALQHMRIITMLKISALPTEENSRDKGNIGGF